MTVQALTPAVEYQLNGSTTAFSAPFRFVPADIRAEIQLAAGGTTALVNGTDFTVTGGATDSGGTVTLANAGTAGDTLAIYRETSRAQTTDYQTNSSFTADSHEAALDRLAQVDQEQDEEIARAPKFARGVTPPAFGNIGVGQVMAMTEDGEVKGVPNDVADIALSVEQARGFAERAEEEAELGIAANTAAQQARSDTLTAQALTEAARDVATDLGNAPLYNTLADLPAASGSQGWAIIQFGADQGVYEDAGSWTRRGDTQAGLSQAWATGTEPGGSGTKSAREWSLEAGAAAAAVPTELAQTQRLHDLNSVVTKMPDGAVFDLAPLDALEVSNRMIPNRVTSSRDGNLAFWRSGDIRAQATSGVVVTQRYADGPTGTSTAARIQFLDSNDIWRLFSTPLPAGTYTIGLQVKSTAGAGNQDIKTGVFNSDLTTSAITEGAWTAITKTITSTGSAPSNFSIFTDTSGTYPIDILVDEIQVYEGSGPLPSWSAETSGVGNLVVEPFSLPNDITTTGYISSAVVNGKIKLAENHAVKTITEGTLFALIKQTSAPNTFGSVVSTDSAEGANYYDLGLGIESGWLTQRAPNNAQTGNLPSQDNRIKILNEGWQIVGVRFNTEGADRWFHDIKVEEITATGSALNARYLIAGGAGNPGNGVFGGEIGGIIFYDRHLSDEECQDVAASYRDRLDLYQEGRPGFDNFYIAEGDSITGMASPVTYSRKQRDAFTPSMKLRVFATSGDTLTKLEDRLPKVIETINAAKRGRRTVVVSVMIGRNDFVSLEAGNRDAYMVRLLAYYDAIRAAGAKLVACTILPSTVTAGYDADRAAVNALITASSDHYDALCDFAADPSYGANGAASNASLFPDGTHPSQAVQDSMTVTMTGVLLPLLKGTVEAVPSA